MQPRFHKTSINLHTMRHRVCQRWHIHVISLGVLSTFGTLGTLNALGPLSSKYMVFQALVEVEHTPYCISNSGEEQ